MNKFVLISKDAMCADYLPVYGNKQWRTPNIDAIAQQGTVFTNYYTAAPSTVMSFFSMVTGKYAHETKYEIYEKLHDVYEGETFFTKLKEKGYTNHFICNPRMMVLTEYFDCFRDDVEFHTLEDFKQGVGAHYSHKGFLLPDEEKEVRTFEIVKKEISDVLSCGDNIFLWIHFPHVINGKVSYGSDIELFDKCVGIIRNLVPDDCIAITADHGNMNGHKGKICYGYDAYQPAIRVPLITPRIDNMEKCDKNASSVDLYNILFEKTVPCREYIYSDTAYKAQKHRKLAIIYDHYKYIYNKKTDTAELYDLDFDPTEEFSIAEDFIFDKDRKIKAPSRELYYYPDWEKLPEIRKKLRSEKERIWKNGSLKVVAKSNLKDMLRPLYSKLTKKKSNAKIQG